MPTDIIKSVSRVGKTQRAPKSLTFADQFGHKIFDSSNDIDDDHDSMYTAHTGDSDNSSYDNKTSGEATSTGMSVFDDNDGDDSDNGTIEDNNDDDESKQLEPIVTAHREIAIPDVTVSANGVTSPVTVGVREESNDQQNPTNETPAIEENAEVAPKNDTDARVVTQNIEITGVQAPRTMENKSTPQTETQEAVDKDVDARYGVRTTDINLRWWVDASFATHDNMRSHTGATVSMGRGSFYSLCTKQ